MSNGTDDLQAHVADFAAAEADPYSWAITTIVTALEYALDDGISGSMNDHEYRILEMLAIRLIELDPHIEIDPKAA